MVPNEMGRAESFSGHFTDNKNILAQVGVTRRNVQSVA